MFKASQRSLGAADLALPLFHAPAGKDATQDFEEIGHSNSARQILSKYLIGDYAVSRAGARGTLLWNASRRWRRCLASGALLPVADCPASDRAVLLPAGRRLCPCGAHQQHEQGACSVWPRPTDEDLPGAAATAGHPGGTPLQPDAAAAVAAASACIGRCRRAGNRHPAVIHQQCTVAYAMSGHARMSLLCL